MNTLYLIDGTHSEYVKQCASVLASESTFSTKVKKTLGMK